MEQTKEISERYVGSDVVAQHLDVTRQKVLTLSRQGWLRSYWLSGYIRKMRKYKISEVEEDMAKLRDESKMDDSSPSDPEQDDKHE